MVEFFTSRKILGIVIGLVVLLLTGAFVGFPDVGLQLLEVVAPVVLYVISVGLTPNPEGFKTVLTSTRFWALIASLASASIKQFFPDFPASEAEIAGVVAMLSSYIIGRGIQHVAPTK
jgi:hypothetical protein